MEPDEIKDEIKDALKQWLIPNGLDSNRDPMCLKMNDFTVAWANDINPTIHVDDLHKYLIQAIKSLSEKEKAEFLYELIKSLLSEKEKENANTAVNICNSDYAKILKGMLNL